VESRVGQGTTFKVLLPARGRDEALKVLVAHRDTTERDYVAAALTGWGHAVVVAEGSDDARTRLRAGGIDVALIDNALMVADSEAWRAVRGADGHAAFILMSEAAGDIGIAPPFELAALRAALRGITRDITHKEYA
jgi:DNA-binding response OmpR family regulator